MGADEVARISKGETKKLNVEWLKYLINIGSRNAVLPFGRGANIQREGVTKVNNPFLIS